MHAFYAFIEILNKLLNLAFSIKAKQKEEKLQDEYSEINDDMEGYLSATRHDLGSGLYKPNGKPPTDKDL